MSISLTDPCGRLVTLPSIPQRIISLVPSQTELLYDLGLENQIVGITRYCVHPTSALTDKKVVGGTKKVVTKRLQDLQPDLIICNKEENTPSIVAQCETIAPTYVSHIETLDDALHMILQIAQLTNTLPTAQTLCQRIQQAFAQLTAVRLPQPALYLIWKDPYMTVGNDTFIHDMMQRLGLRNAAAAQQRYPQLSMEQLVDLKPAVVLLSSEPYDFKPKDAAVIESAFAKANLPTPKCIIVDGELFSWYGSRLSKSPAYFKKLQHQLVVDTGQNS